MFVYVSECMQACNHKHILAYFGTCIPRTYLHAHVPTYLLTYLPTYLATYYLPIYVLHGHAFIRTYIHGRLQ